MIPLAKRRHPRGNRAGQRPSLHYLACCECLAFLFVSLQKRERLNVPLKKPHFCVKARLQPCDTTPKNKLDFRP